MSDLTKFSDGASILQQVDVSSIFKNLAMGIAEAQQKLDDNSIAQAIKLAETQINGVSLLELGFAPVFYAFQYADISASINLQMALKEELEFGFGLSIELATKKGYSSEDRTFIGEDNYSETQSEYKSSAILTVRANSKKAVKIEGHSYMLDENLKAKSRVENLKEQIYEDESNIEQIYDEIKGETLTEDKSRGIDVWVDGGYLRVETSLHHKVSGVGGIGVLKITEPETLQSVDLDGAGTGAFETKSNLEASLIAAEAANEGAEIYGFSKDGDLWTLDGSTWQKISSKFYFAYNRDEITYGVDLKLTSDPTPVTYDPPIAPGYSNMNHPLHETVHKVLRVIQKNDPKASITITGVTDPKGGDNPKNQSLAKRRAEKLRDHIFGTGNTLNVIAGSVTNPSGANDLKERYAKIGLNADYIVIVSDNITRDATPTKAEDVANKFVYADDTSGGAFNKLDVKYGSNHLTYSIDTTNKNMTTLAQYVKGNIRENSYEKINERHYFLEDESVLKFYLYNSKSEDIKVEIDEETNSDGTQNTNTWMTSKTKNQKSVLSESLNKKSKDNSFALGASIDFRLSRQFEMTLEGNSAMSARLVAAPAPAGFLVFVQNVFSNNTNTGE